MMNFESIEKLKSIIDEKEKEISRLLAIIEQERIKFKNEQQESNDYYESILAVLPGNVYWLNRNNTFLGCNDLQAENAHLGSKEEIVGKTNYDMPWKDQAEELNRFNDMVMETGIPQTSEEYAVMANGLAVYLSQKTALRNKKNEIIGIVGVSIDITEQKKMEAALRRAKEVAEIANHAKTEFIANMSHDIHTPLSGIVGLSQLLEDTAKDKQEKQYAHWINESGKQLLALLNEILYVVSDDQKKTSEINEEIVDLRQSVNGIIALVLPTVKIKNIDLNLEIDEAVPEKLITDGIKLHRILLNLVGNAIKFTEEGSIAIKIKVVVDDTEYVQLQFSVSDTGIGIPPEFQTNIFERFFRISPSSKTKCGGHGVGLHIAQNYVGLLGGEITLDSELGKGSTFYFTLPMKVANIENLANQNDLTSTTQQKIASKGLLAADAPHILLVEANIVALRFMESLAIQMGCRFASASDAEHALQLVKTMDFDLLFTDIELPGFSGNELTRIIREWEQLSHKKPIPIIGLTAHHLEENPQELLEFGMNKVISKPLHLNTMQSLVNQYVVKNASSVGHTE